MGPIVGETPTTSKLPPEPSSGKGKGPIKGPDLITEKWPVLLREDSGYALKHFSSIIKDDDYKDLGNLAIGAMGGTGLFSLAQVCLSIPFFLSCPIVVLF